MSGEPARGRADAGQRVPEAVLWDMDGTLVDSEKLWDIPLYEWAELAGGRLTAQRRSGMVGMKMADTAAILLEVVGRPVDADGVAEVSEWVSARMAELFTEDLPWRPGAEDALRAVRASGVPMALVTSTERALTEIALRTITAPFDGQPLFEATVCGDEVDGRNKPHPEPYLRAARLLGVDAADCVAIEDSPTGSTSAVAAGCRVLVVPCDVAVPAGPGRVLRDSLIGVDLDVLAALRPDPVPTGG